MDQRLGIPTLEKNFGSNISKIRNVSVLLEQNRNTNN